MDSLHLYAENAREIRRLQEEIVTWRGWASMAARRLDSVPGQGGGQDRMSRAVEQITELEQQLAGQLEQRVRLRRQAESLVESLPDPLQREVCRHRFFNEKSLEAIAEELDTSVKTVRRRLSLVKRETVK